MKRMYFPNRDVTVDGITISITSGGKPYIVSNGTFRKANHIHTKEGLFVELPNGKMARCYLVMGKVEAEICVEPPENKEGDQHDKSVHNDRKA